MFFKTVGGLIDATLLGILRLAAKPPRKGKRRRKRGPKLRGKRLD
jgi:hypothetical protein